MSDGLIPAIGLKLASSEIAAILPDSIGIPSIIYNGSLEPFIEAPPLSVIVLPAPGSPELDTIFSPGTRPWSPLSRLSPADLSRSCAETDVTAPVTSIFLCVP